MENDTAIITSTTRRTKEAAQKYVMMNDGSKDNRRKTMHGIKILLVYSLKVIIGKTSHIIRADATIFNSVKPDMIAYRTIGDIPSLKHKILKGITEEIIHNDTVFTFFILPVETITNEMGACKQSNVRMKSIKQANGIV